VFNRAHGNKYTLHANINHVAVFRPYPHNATCGMLQAHPQINRLGLGMAGMTGVLNC
jgi:hypothetical protein